MNQYIGSLRELDQVLAVPSVAREHHRVPRVIDAVAERWFDRRVVHREGRDFQIAILIDHTLLNILGHDHRALRGKFLIYVAPDMDIELVSLLQMRHHVGRARRSPDPERCVSPHDPACQIQIGNSDDVIGMQVGQKQGSDIARKEL